MRRIIHMQSAKKSYRIDEVAAEFDVSKRTVERAVARGEIDSFKIRDTRRITVEEVERIKWGGRTRRSAPT